MAAQRHEDSEWEKLMQVFKAVQSMLESKSFSDGKRKLALCHYPMMSWSGTGKGSYLIHGHIHNNREAAYWPLLARMDHALNASVEINHYQPVTFDQLVYNNDLLKK